jgi:hypothetical protein
LMRCALKGHQNAAPASNSYLPKNAPSFSRHFQGAFLDGGYPRLKPRLRKAYVAARLSDYAGRQTRARQSAATAAWAEILSPFRGERAQDRERRHYPPKEAKRDALLTK